MSEDYQLDKMKARRRALQAAWHLVEDEDKEMGLKAYPVYHATLRGLATHYNLPFVATVEAFVALSPNNDYHGNLRSLASILVAIKAGNPFEDCVISTYRACGARAWGYLRGEVSFLDKVKGRKITSFRDNILYLDESRKVTVDGHMICIASDTNLTMTQANAYLRDKYFYDDVEQPVLSIANKTMPPCAVQASLWTWRKRTLGIKFDPQTDLFTGRTRWDGVLDPTEILAYVKGEDAPIPEAVGKDEQLWLL